MLAIGAFVVVTIRTWTDEGSGDTGGGVGGYLDNGGGATVLGLDGGLDGWRGFVRGVDRVVELPAADEPAVREAEASPPRVVAATGAPPWLVALVSQYPWPVDTMLRIIWRESRYDPGAYNRSSGASGLLQVMPGWASENPDYWTMRFDSSWNVALGWYIYQQQGLSAWY